MVNDMKRNKIYIRMKPEYQFLVSCVSVMILTNYFMLYSLQNRYDDSATVYVNWKVLKLSSHHEIPTEVLDDLMSSVKQIKQMNQRKAEFVDNLRRSHYKNETTSDNSWKRILMMNSTGLHSFNATISDKIGVYRENLVDTRIEPCKRITYNISELPDTSVIIVFYNEAWSTLLRTVHSILDKSPGSLIKEIILVDDASTSQWLKEPLSDYIDHLNKV